MESTVRISIVDGHPDAQRPIGSLLDTYAASLAPEATGERMLL